MDDRLFLQGANGHENIFKNDRGFNVIGVYFFDMPIPKGP